MPRGNVIHEKGKNKKRNASSASNCVNYMRCPLVPSFVRLFECVYNSPASSFMALADRIFLFVIYLFINSDELSELHYN